MKVAWHEVPGKRPTNRSRAVRYGVMSGYQPTGSILATPSRFCESGAALVPCPSSVAILAMADKPGRIIITRESRHFVPGLRQAQSNRYHHPVPPGRKPAEADAVRTRCTVLQYSNTPALRAAEIEDSLSDEAQSLCCRPLEVGLASEARSTKGTRRRRKDDDEDENEALAGSKGVPDEACSSTGA